MGSASGLRDGNQAKKAQLFTVSVFGSHAGPGSAKSDSFLSSSLGPPPTSSFSGVVAGTGIVDHEMDGAFVRRPPRCDSTCGQRVGALSSGRCETEVHEMEWVATLDETELQDAQVHAFGGENVGVFHVHNVLGNVNRSRRASGSRVIPPSRGGSGAVLPTQRRLRGRGTTLLRSGNAVPGRGAPGRTRPEAGSDSFVLSFEQCETHIARSHRVNVTLLEGVSCSSSFCFSACTSHTSHTSHACDTGVHPTIQKNTSIPC